MTDSYLEIEWSKGKAEGLAIHSGQSLGISYDKDTVPGTVGVI